VAWPKTASVVVTQPSVAKIKKARTFMVNFGLNLAEMSGFDEQIHVAAQLGAALRRIKLSATGDTPATAKTGRGFIPLA